MFGFAAGDEGPDNSPHIGYLSWSLGLLTSQLREGEGKWDARDRRPVAREEEEQRKLDS